MPAVPASAKKPTGRQPKAAYDPPSKAGAEPKKVTVSGREWSIPADVLDDFELLDDLAALEHGNATRLPATLRRLIGDQWDEAMGVLRDEATGRVTLDAGMNFAREILEALNPNS